VIIDDKVKFLFILMVGLILGLIIIDIGFQELIVEPEFLERYDHDLQLITTKILDVRMDENESYAVFEIGNYRFVQVIGNSSKLIKGDKATVIYYENIDSELVSIGVFFSMEEALEEMIRINTQLSEYKK